MPSDWFRSPAWDERARTEFETKLARSAAHNRPQYLRIKAIALDGVGLTADALALLMRVTDDYPDSLDCASAFELQGDILRRTGDLAAAEGRYRVVLARRPDLNATSGMTPVSLAEVLLEQHGSSAVEEVRSLLAYPALRLVFNSQLVRTLMLSSRTAEVEGDDALRRAEARRALDLVGAAPQLNRHPDVGVPAPSEAELRELERLASDTGLTPKKRNWFRRP